MQACLKQATKIISVFIILSFLVTSSLWAIKSASIVICAETGKVLHEHNADVITHPASLTKMMTLFLAFKALKGNKLSLYQKLPVSKHASIQAPSKLWLKPKSTITVKDAILACATKSANDAAVVLAESMGNGSESHFASLMTQEAKRLGMKNTIFKNASGLPNKAHITTARDMAILSQALHKKFPEYFKVFKEKKFVYKGQVHANHNHLLGKVNGVDGIKTGFTNASGFNLAASMTRNNRRIIAVVLGGETRHARDKKTTHLLETTYNSIHRTGPFKNQRQYESIDEIIYDIASAEDNVIPATSQGKSKLKKAIYSSTSGKSSSLKAKYTSMGGLLSEIDKPTLPQKRVMKKKKEKSTGQTLKNKRRYKKNAALHKRKKLR